MQRGNHDVFNNGIQLFAGFGGVSSKSVVTISPLMKSGIHNVAWKPATWEVVDRGSEIDIECKWTGKGPR